MLILSRRVGEGFVIGNDIVVKIVEVSGNQIRLGISAPREIRVLREEIYNAIQEENRAAAGRPESSRRLEDVGKRLRSKTLE
jgi:carbon storage regulator